MKIYTVGASKLTTNFYTSELSYNCHLMLIAKTGPNTKEIISKAYKYPTITQSETTFCVVLSASLEKESLPKWSLLLKERICSKSKFFLLRVDPIE